MSRILWLSNAPWAGSGYGEQTALFVERLRADGHDLAILANYGLQSQTMNWQGLTCYPSDGVWGNVALPIYADHFRADLCIALCDSWVLDPSQWAPEMRLAIWAPIDHYPIPPAVLAVLSDDRITPIAMSRFGETLLRQAECDPLYVPHGVDTAKFRPQPEIRDRVRDELSIPRDAFLVGMVAANKGNPSTPRKGFPQAFHAFANFARGRDDVWLYAHTEAKPIKGGGGIALDVLAEAVGAPVGRVRFPHDHAWLLGMPSSVVAALYNAFDVLLMPSMGEGFGIPLIEAQACGCPVIASNHSAMTELTQAGWLVDGEPWWDSLASSFFVVPSIASITAALEAAYEARDDARLRAGAVAFASAYDCDVVFERYWRPAIEKLAGRPSNEVAKQEEVAA